METLAPRSSSVQIMSKSSGPVRPTCSSTPPHVHERLLTEEEEVLQIRGLPLEGGKALELLEAGRAADLSQYSHAIVGEPAEPGAHDVGLMAQADFHGPRVEPIVGKEEADTLRRGRTDTSIQRGGKAASFFGQNPNPAVFQAEAVEIPGRRGLRERLRDNDCFDVSSLGAGGGDALS